MVQSICQDDFAPALENIVSTMAKPLELCVAQKLTREADGTVKCAMYWELAPASQSPTAPVDCLELGVELLDPLALPSQTESGGQRCLIHQLAVQGGKPSEGEGWYYDEFTPGLDRMCSGGLSRRIAFTPGARAPQECP